MKQYEEPILIEKEKKREGRSLHKKGTKQICPKEKNQYAECDNTICGEYRNRSQNTHCTDSPGCRHAL